MSLYGDLPPPTITPLDNPAPPTFITKDEKQDLPGGSEITKVITSKSSNTSTQLVPPQISTTRSTIKPRFVPIPRVTPKSTVNKAKKAIVKHSTPLSYSAKDNCNPVLDEAKKIENIEYNPLKPNDYEEYKKARQLKKAKATAAPAVENTHPTTTSNSASAFFSAVEWKKMRSQTLEQAKKKQAKTESEEDSDEDFDGVPLTQSSLLGAGLGLEKKPTIESPNTGQQSRVILLTNMVGPGEVDEMLEEETAEECTKYGTVIKCDIFEVKDKNCDSSEAVRIFVKFKRDDMAQSALNDLNGRYFGGRVVKCSYFDESKFDRGELEPGM